MIQHGNGLTRRELLQAGAAAGAGLALPALSAREAQAAVRSGREVNCIMIFMVGGPSHLDTWDPKPDAPAEVRGPFKPIRTPVDGMQISELFPQMARHAEKYSLVRSVHHTAAAIHDTGHQLLQTGRLVEEGAEHPHPGAVVSALRGERGSLPPYVVLPSPIGATGGNLSHGQGAGLLSARHEPLTLSVDPSRPDFSARDLFPPDYAAAVRRERREALRGAVGEAVQACGSTDPAGRDPHAAELSERLAARECREAFDLRSEPERLRERYGMNKFGQSCLLARRLVERGTRFVTLNMYETVFNETTWDCHGSLPFTPLEAYRDQVGPTFDHGYSTLLQDLSERGLLEETLVVCLSEFGRTPQINPVGGRDHWPHCWTIFFAGGGIRGGRVVGASDEIGAYPKERPVTPAEVAATVYHALGIDTATEVPAADGGTLPLVDPAARAIHELF
ncbi:MAG: DUF1501 domain-containing protein [Armatimonadota bacterium]